MHSVSSITHPAKKLGVTIFLSVLIFICLEIFLQLRSHIMYGQSVFNALGAETRYVIHPSSGLKTLRPNHVFRGREIEIRTNSLGLRSEPLESVKPAGTFRIVVIGASTVMGAYAVTNEDTFSYRLEGLLNKQRPKIQFQVVNAGIVAYTLNDERRLIEKIIQPLVPDLIVVYPGLNDAANYCRDQPSVVGTAIPKRTGLPVLEAPEWLLSIALIQKNTVGFRSPPTVKNYFKSPDNLDLLPFRQELDALIRAAQATGARVIMATNARAYRPEQPLEVQVKLSETARYFNPCFDIEGLHKLYDLHNQEIISAAQRLKVDVVRLGELIPGGREYFVDANHFAGRGEQIAAEQLYFHLISRKLVPLK